jgi:hypothetical protein
MSHTVLSVCRVVILNINYSLGFEVLTVVNTKMAVFWVVAPSSLVEGYQCIGGPCCLYHQGADDGGNKDLSNIGELPDYTAPQPRRQPSS